MPIPVSVFELILIAVAVLLTAIALMTRGYARSKPFVAVSVCLISASLLTPSDPLSTIVVFLALLGMLILGSRVYLNDLPSTN